MKVIWDSSGTDLGRDDEKTSTKAIPLEQAAAMKGYIDPKHVCILQLHSLMVGLHAALDELTSGWRYQVFFLPTPLSLCIPTWKDCDVLSTGHCEAWLTWHRRINLLRKDDSRCLYGSMRTTTCCDGSPARALPFFARACQRCTLASGTLSDAQTRPVFRNLIGVSAFTFLLRP